MSNKYKNSWKRIESLDIWSIPPNTPSSNWGEYIKCGDDIEASYQISEDLDLIQELVDKETPMKPDYGEDVAIRSNMEIFDIDAWCGSCKYQVSKKGKYCPSCGQVIDWSDEE